MATALIPIQVPVQYGALRQRDLIEENMSLVKYLATRLSAKLPPNIEVDDLVGAGMLGLIDAAEKFDPSRGIRFRTYAERRIRGAILDHLRGLDWAPRSLRRRAREVEVAQASLERECGRSVEASEVAQFLDLNLEDLQSLMFELNAAQITSLQAATECDTDNTSSREMGRDLPDAPERSPYAVYAKRELRARVASAVQSLPEKEKLVISLYYVEELTMKEIGSVIGVNESRVSQIHSKAITRLRSALVSLAA